jgi:hypothetical protein
VKARLETALKICSLVVFPALLLLFVAMYSVDRRAYAWLLDEDGLVENLTVVFLVLAAVVAAATAWRKRPGERRWFYVAVAALCLLGALDEVSWGQRILGYESPEFFRRHARQQETNLHNVFQKWTTLKVKDVAPVLFLAYGIGLPLAARRSARVRALAERVGLRYPPLVLSGGFVLGGLLTLDYPTKREEEIGELFFSLCLFLFMLFEATKPGVLRPSR